MQGRHLDRIPHSSLFGSEGPSTSREDLWAVCQSTFLMLHIRLLFTVLPENLDRLGYSDQL
jgi:hypothetical protein